MVGLDQTGIGGYIRPRTKYQDVPRDYLFGFDFFRGPVPDHQGLGPDQGLQGVDGLLGLAFGDIADHRVDRHHRGDDHGVGDPGGGYGNPGRYTQQGHREGLELVDKDAETRAGHGLGKDIGPEFLQPGQKLRLGEPQGRVGAELFQQIMGLQKMPGLGRLVFGMKDQFPDFSAAGGCLLTENGRQGIAGFLLDRHRSWGFRTAFPEKKGGKVRPFFPGLPLSRCFAEN